MTGLPLQNRLPAQRLAAVVLHRADRGEADLIMTFLTREYGLVSALAKNAKRSVRRFGGRLLRPGTAAWYEFRIRPDRELAFVEKGEINPQAPDLPGDPLVLALVSWALELVRGFEASHNPAPETFALLVRHLGRLARAEQNEERLRRLSLDFTLKYLELAGFGPRLDDCLICGRAAAPETGWFWDPGAGGLYCPHCRQSLARLPKNTLAISEILLGCLLGWTDGGSLRAHDLASAEFFFASLAETQLGRPLKSLKVLRQLQQAG